MNKEDKDKWKFDVDDKLKRTDSYSQGMEVTED